jgi:hypothetical protein
VLKLIRTGVVKRSTVSDGVRHQAWGWDIEGELSVEAVLQYLQLWSALVMVPLGEGEDTFCWKWTEDGKFMARSAYHVFFHGTIALPGATHVWNCFASYKFLFHAWLSLRGRCWTADRRLRRDLPTHVLCPLCSVLAETADHLALKCNFTHAIWDAFSRRAGVKIPTRCSDSQLSTWWPDVVNHLSRADAIVVNSAMMLILRLLWLERNAMVFEDTVSSVDRVLDAVH